MDELSIQILSVPHREKLIAEIQYSHHVIAEINQDREYVEIEVFSYDDFPIALPIDNFIEVIKEAKAKLLEE
ncbi:hypothetical protein [Phocaeicola sartorii]|uniref:hypothetical protein n=1 Tax=Phocaeicola sartorii TaxID=671267 RepID=UPI0004696E02|nr:hypothetical protein [Phocaeicola sartorii]